MPQTRRTAEAVVGPQDPRTGAPAPLEEGQEPGAGQPPQEQTEVIAADEHHAGHLRESVPSIFMFASLSQAFKVIDQRAYKLYRDRLLSDCGSPTDPIEVMIIEQLALAHFSQGLLSCKAANAGKVEAVGVYAGAAARLMGEFRRSALALQAYRAASRQLAHDPTKDLVMPHEETDPIDDQLGKECIDGKQDATMEVPDAGEPILPYPRPASLGDQSPQSPTLARHDARRKGKAPRRNPGESALGAVHGAANG